MRASGALTLKSRHTRGTGTHSTSPLSWITQSRNAEIAAVTDESVSGVRVVTAFARGQRQIDKADGGLRSW